MERKWTKPPSIPENFVTLLQLKEQWIKQQDQKQPQSEPEAQELRIGDVLEENNSIDTKEEFKESKNKNWWKEDENNVAGEANAREREETSLVSRNEGRLRKKSTGVGRGGEKETSEGAAGLNLSQTTARQREAWNSKRIQKKGEWKKVNKEVIAGIEAHDQKMKEERTASSGNANVADQTVNEIEGKLEDASINGGKERENDERVLTNKEGYNRSDHRSGGEMVENAKSENDVVVDGQMVQIEGNLKYMPTSRGRGRAKGRPARPNNGGNYTGYYRRFECHHVERKQKDAAMVWVKKGDGSGGNAGELKSSGGSISGSA